MKFILKQKKRSAVSPVIATLLLIAIAVAAAIIVYAFVTGLIGGLTTTGGSSLVQVTGTLTVPSGSGAATLVLNVKNSANNPVNTITIAVDASDGALTGTTGASTVTDGGTGAQIYSGSLPIGQSASAVLSFPGGADGNVIAGNTYTFTVTIAFSGGTSTQIQTLSLTAQV